MTFMAALSMRFLGVADLTFDGVPVQLERLNSLALPAYLVLTDRTHSRDELATLMAGDIADDPARKRLRNALADLVEYGLGDYLLTSRQTVAFNAARPHTLDIRQLDDLRAAETSPEPGGLAWAADRCDWELLTGLALRDAPAFEIWLLGERERRGQQLRELTQQHLQWLLTSDQIEAGVSLAHRLLAVEPWNEAVHRLLMRLLARGGQLAAALA
jgi:DNA-binding SARP family transcriptional activator